MVLKGVLRFVCVHRFIALARLGRHFCLGPNVHEVCLGDEWEWEKHGKHMGFHIPFMSDYMFHCRIICITRSMKAKKRFLSTVYVFKYLSWSHHMHQLV